MDIAAQQRMLYAIAGICLLGATGAVYWSTSDISPLRVAIDRRESGLPATNVDAMRARANGDEIDLARSLRGPLYDPPPPIAAPQIRPTPRPKPTPTLPPLNLTLVGTIIDPDQSLAIIADAAGNFDVKGVGDSLELTPAGVRIGHIESEVITLEYQGRESMIRLDRDRLDRDRLDREVSQRPAGVGRQGNNRRRNQ
jgi:hypothetical protein